MFAKRLALLAQQAHLSRKAVLPSGLASLIIEPVYFDTPLTQGGVHYLTYAVNVWGVPQLQPAPKASLLSWRDTDRTAALGLRSAGGKEPRRWLSFQSTVTEERLKELTQLMTGSTSWEAVAALVRARGREFNRYNCGAAWTTLAKWHKKLPDTDRQQMRADGIFFELEQLSAPLVPSFQARQLANVLHSMATVQHQPDPQLLERMKGKLSKLLPRCNAQNISNTVWAFATLGHNPGQEMLQSMKEAIRQLLPTCNSQAVSNILWAFATLGHDPGQELLQRIKEAIGQLLPTYKPQEVSNTLWAFASLGHHPGQEVLQRMCHRAVELLPEMIPQNVSNMVWALGKLQPVPVPHQLLEGGCSTVLNNMHGFNTQNLSNTFLGLAHLGYQPKPEFVGAVAQHAIAVMDQFSNQALVNLTWSIVKLNMDPGGDYWIALYTDLLHRASGFTAEDISNTLWAAATRNNLPPAEVVDALFRRAFEILPSFDPQQQCNTLWAAASLGIALSPQVMQAFLRVCLSLLPFFNEQDISNVVWALGRMKYRPPDVFLAPLVTEAGKSMYKFSAAGFTMTFWGLNELGIDIDDSVLNMTLEKYAARLSSRQ